VVTRSLRLPSTHLTNQIPNPSEWPPGREGSMQVICKCMDRSFPSLKMTAPDFCHEVAGHNTSRLLKNFGHCIFWEGHNFSHGYLLDKSCNLSWQHESDGKEVNRQMLDGTVEIDETYVRGKKQGHQRKPGFGECTKQIVIGIGQRGGDLPFFHAAGRASTHLRKTYSLKGLCS